MIGRYRFPLGRQVITPGATSRLAELAYSPNGYLVRHALGDWGDIDADDWAANDAAVSVFARLVSAYALPADEMLYVITEADRSVTTILLASEY